jgi:hypothetical protein
LLEAFEKLSVDSTVSRAYDEMLEYEKMQIDNAESKTLKGVAP